MVERLERPDAAAVYTRFLRTNEPVRASRRLQSPHRGGSERRRDNRLARSVGARRCSSEDGRTTGQPRASGSPRMGPCDEMRFLLVSGTASHRYGPKAAKEELGPALELT